jgi:hypothetical protein
MSRCYACGSSEVNVKVALGPQPVCNRFLAGRDAEEYRHDFSVAQCAHCGLVQLPDPFPADALVPPFDWITYSEPEDHLDGMVETLRRLPGLGPEAKIGAVSFKDDSTLERFRKIGWKNTWRIDPKLDLGVDRAGIGAETIQAYINPSVAARLVAKYGKSDVVIVRHIYEHAYDLKQFAEGIRALLSPGGYAVFEVPDCERALGHSEFTTLWEEHVVYFTAHTLKQTLSLTGFDVAHFEVYPYAFESSLIAVAKPRTRGTSIELDRSAIDREIARFTQFSANLTGYGERLRRYLAAQRQRDAKIAVFGAGHLAATYINIFGIAPDIAFVVDDNPHKRGLLMPGSRLPIRESGALTGERIDLCLLGINPLSEEKVIARNQGFVEQGGRFASIFVNSSRALAV